MQLVCERYRGLHTQETNGSNMARMEKLFWNNIRTCETPSQLFSQDERTNERYPFFVLQVAVQGNYVSVHSGVVVAVVVVVAKVQRVSTVDDKHTHTYRRRSHKVPTTRSKGEMIKSLVFVVRWCSALCFFLTHSRPFFAKYGKCGTRHAWKEKLDESIFIIIRKMACCCRLKLTAIEGCHHTWKLHWSSY